GGLFMRLAWIGVLCPAVLLAGSSFSSPSDGGKTDAAHSKNIMATVLTVTRAKILESNNVTLRPGSVYDTTTYFESLLGLQRPSFNYEFIDAGLGAAEPVYPSFEHGQQDNYAQVLAGMFSEDNRHIDHYATAETPEGCRVDSSYLARSLSEYPDTAFKTFRDEG